MNEQKRDSYFRKLVANARAIISYQIGLPVGRLKMERIFYWLKNEGYGDAEYPIFKTYCDATHALLIGSERLNCSREALRRNDESLVAINLKYREQIIDACFEIVERFGKGNTDSVN
jgi:hypothetical protein